MKAVGIIVKNLTSGGAEKQSVLLAKALAGDYATHYFIFNGNKVHAKYLDSLNDDKRITVHVFQGTAHSRICQLIRCLKTSGVGVLFSYLTMANAIAVAAGRLAGVGRIYTGIRNARLSWLKMQVDKLLCNHFATAAVSNSYSAKRYLSGKGFNQSKVIVIPNCYDNISPYTEKNAREVVTIVTVGRFVEQKDYETAIRAVAEARKKCRIRFVIVGYGKLEPKVRAWVEGYGISDITQLEINPDNISEIERSADIYLSTSLFEGTSNSIMEGLDADLPVICTDVGDNSRLVTDGVNGYLCNVGDTHGIAMRIVDLANDDGKRHLFGKKSKETLLANYGMEVFRQRYVDIIEGTG